MGEQLRDSAPRSFIEGLDLSSAMLQQASGPKGMKKKLKPPKGFSFGNGEMVKLNLTANIANLARLKNKSGREFQKIMWLLRVLQ